MYNILIVDDEMIMCDFLEKTITNLQEYNIRLAGIAHNATEALEFIKRDTIHIVITDIVMPETNGIQLIKQAQQEDSNIKFIVLSGYDDFDYVQSAYRLGVIDYILKTSISPDYLKTLILDSLPSIQSNISKTSAVQDCNKNSYREQFLLQQNLLSYFFTPNPEKNMPVLPDNFLATPEAEIRVLYITLFFADNYISSIWKNDYTSMNLGFSNIFYELINNYGSGFSYTVDYSHYALVLDAKIPVQKLFTDILTAFKTYFHLNISGVVSKSEINSHKILSLYNQCVTCAPYYFYIGKNILFAVKEYIPVSIPINIPMKLKELQEFLNNAAPDMVLKYIDSLTIYDKKYSISDLQKLYIQYAYALENFCKTNNMPTSRINQFLSKRESYDLFECNKWLKNTLLFICESKDQKGNLIDKIKLYTENHCTENITLDHVASKFNISKWYFCRLFQQKTNTSFNNYLSLCRIEKAKKLIDEDNFKISAVASECGYSSAEHFSRSFKKITGLSPSQYQKNQRKNKGQ